jgi:hexulose-6-phosphate isomerase
MKKSISCWAFPATKSIRDILTEAKKAGFEAVELAVAEAGELSLTATHKQCEQIRKEAASIGVEISSVATGIYWSYNFASPAPADRRKAEAATERMLRIASWLGTDALLVIPGAVDVVFIPSAPVIPYDTVLERAKEGIQKVLRAAQKCKVAIAVENVWNKFLLSPTEMRDFVDSFGSPYVGCYFDVGNAVAYGYPEHWIRILGKRIKRIHLKDFKRAVNSLDGFCDLLEGDVNWPEVMRALKEVGYDSYLSAEMIPLYKHHSEVRIRNTSNAMDAILGRAR